MTKLSKEVPKTKPQKGTLVQTGKEALKLMEKAYPRVLALEQTYHPAFARAEAATAGARADEEARIVQRQGGAVRDALRGTPEVAEATDAIMAELRGTGPSEIERRLQGDALSELALGTRLSSDQERDVQQATRAAWSARGLAQGNPAMVSEVLNRDAAGQARLASRRAFAAGVDAQVQQRKSGDRAFALNALQGMGGFYDPYQRIFGRGGSQASGQVAAPENFNAFMGTALQQRQMDMQERMFYDGMAAEKEAMMFNAGENRYISGRNNSAATSGAAMAATGAVLGALIGLI